MRAGNPVLASAAAWAPSYHRLADRSMCGICAVLGDDVTESRLASMLETIIHRGPDGEGRLVEAGAALGMSRATTYRHWTYARAWLRYEIDQEPSG